MTLVGAAGQRKADIDVTPVNYLLAAKLWPALVGREQMSASSINHPYKLPVS